MDSRAQHVYRIRGGLRLVGRVTAAGSKNASLPIMAASLLASETLELHRVPLLADVDTMTGLLESLGVDIRRTTTGALTLAASSPGSCIAPAAFVRRMRASFCVLGPLLARHRRAIVPLPGGCAIGPRPVDIHLRGLAALGADISIDDGVVFARADRLQGATIDLSGSRGPSVTGTANVLSAAVLARGTSLLTGAATEPEVVDLGHFLRRLGARIEGLGTSTLVVRGVDQLGGCRHETIADRIETATLLIAAAMTGGDVQVDDVAADHLGAVLETLAGAGLGVDVGPRYIRLRSSPDLRPLAVVARPYPGLPTDVQAQLTALAATIPGRSTVADTVFPKRFRHVLQLRRFGMDAARHGNRVEIRGGAPLRPATTTACDLRASAALILTALAADGVSHVRRVDHLDRGYENLAGKLRALGADVARLRPRLPRGRARPAAAGRQPVAGPR